MVAERRIGYPPLSMAWAKMAKIFGGREQASVSGNAAEDARVFVLHFALDDPVAEGAIVGCGRDGVSLTRTRD